MIVINFRQGDAVTPNAGNRLLSFPIYKNKAFEIINSGDLFVLLG